MGVVEGGGVSEQTLFFDVLLIQEVGVVCKRICPPQHTQICIYSIYAHLFLIVASSSSLKDVPEYQYGVPGNLIDAKLLDQIFLSDISDVSDVT